jgi:amino acid adenylation domain-containing protein
MVQASALSLEIHDRRGGIPVLREAEFPAVSNSACHLDSTLTDLLRIAAHRNPEAIAVSDASGSLSYAQLWNFADGFRRRLISQGAQLGDMVGIATGRSVATVAALLGVVMVGGCYVPVDLEDFPVAFSGRLVEEYNLRHWMVDADGRQSHGPLWSNCSVLPLEGVTCPNNSELAEVPSVPVRGDSPLYVMFTSGSTGAPKGVVAPHRAVARLVTGQKFLEFGPQHTFLLHSPLSFDASTLELWGSLLHGSRLVVAPKGRLGLDDYAKLLRDEKVTTLWLTAAMFHLAAEHAPEMFGPLRQLVFGGDVISPHHVERVRGLYPALHMVNGYGPTENTTFTCCYVVPQNYRAEGSLPIGTPIAGTTVHILDAQLQPVPEGEEGELVTGGAGVALGYLNQPEATAERFVCDPFSAGPQARMYRTGDRVRLRKDGAIEFFGRIDRQIKIAGHRVELAAVESAIAGAPPVADAAVVVLAPASGEKQLAACVLLRQPQENAEAQLREWLRRRLSTAEIPPHWLFLEQLPINANGKVDRAVLQAECERKFLLGRDLQDEPQIANLRPSERSDVAGTLSYLRQLWGHLLGRESIADDENFFDLGGTSLLLIEMHARLRAQFASVPSLVEMFDFPTPQTLATRLNRGQQTWTRNNTEPTAAEERGQRQRAAMLGRRMAAAALKETSRGGRALADARKDGAS